MYFFAGLNAGAGGVFGRIDLGATAPDVVAPTTAITSPAQAAAVTGIVPINANANDNIGVTQVEFFAGATSIGVDTTAPYSIDWNSATVANGAINLTARARDGAGNITVSTAVNVTVNN